MSSPGADLPAGSTVLVTGASGFIGPHVCGGLAAAGLVPRALVHRGGGPAPAGVEAVEAADLSDAGALAEAVAGAAAVVHLAGRAHVFHETSGDAEAAFHDVNAEGARRVLQAAACAGARVFVLMSSLAAVATRSDGVLDEGSAPAPDTPYGRSKRRAEEAVARLADEAGVRAAWLRPPMVYGPGMKGNPLRLFRLVSTGLPVPVPAAPNLRSLVYVENLAAAVVAVLCTPAARGAFFVCDGRDLSTAEMVREAARALGRPARLVPVPFSLMRAAGRVGDAASRVVRVPVTSDAVSRFFGTVRVDPSRLARVTGFRPPYTVEEGFRATARWFLAARRER